MADEADSKHTTPNTRWAETTAEVPDATNVVEPSGGKRDIGWIPGGEGLVGEWLNHLHWAAGVNFRYIDNSRDLMWTRNHVMAGASAGEGAVTAGVGLSVNVTSARVWISGQMQKVPAATNLALAAADPTNDRIDLVYAHVVTSVPVYTVVTGTPAAFPVAPALPAGAVPMAEVEVEAADATPGSIVDRRFFGAVTLDLARIDKQFVAGALGANNFVVDLQDLGAAFSLKLGGSADPAMEISDFGPQCIVKPEVFSFFTPIVRKYDIDANDMTPTNTGVNDPTYDQTNTQEYWDVESGGGRLRAAVRVPNGCTITAVRVYGTKATDPDGVSISLIRRGKAANAIENILTGDLSEGPTNAGEPAGDFVLQQTGLSEVVTQASTYFLRILGDAGTTSIWSAEVEYTETNPFNGL